MAKTKKFSASVRERSARYRKQPDRAGAKRTRPKSTPRDGGYAYAAVFERAEEGGYVVHFPAFGMATQGETLAEARSMAADCLEGRIACMLEAGEELPPSDVAAGLPRVEAVRVKPKTA